jgi:hypothetical protein
MTKAKKPSKKAPKKSRGELSEKDADRVAGGDLDANALTVKSPMSPFQKI